MCSISYSRRSKTCLTSSSEARSPSLTVGVEVKSTTSSALTVKILASGSGAVSFNSNSVPLACSNAVYPKSENVPPVVKSMAVPTTQLVGHSPTLDIQHLKLEVPD